MPLRLFDAHNHLQEFAGRADFERLVRETREAGVARMVVNGTREEDWAAVAELARRWPELVIPAFGLHPWHAAGRSPDWRDRLETLLTEFPEAAVGEIGLDRWIPDHDWEGQLAVFFEQWRLAATLHRVAVVHCLRAFGPLEEALRSRPATGRGWLFHSYGGPVAMVPAFVALGASFSFSGYFLHPRKIDDRSAAFAAVPRSRLLLESDAPDMAPPPDLRRFACPTRPDGKPENHPGNLVGVCEGLAPVLGFSPKALAELTTDNAERLFGGDSPLSRPPAGS